MMEKLAFINSVKGGAVQSYKKFNILPSVTIAQAILESGWGESALTKKANNLFGIKKGLWFGETVEMKTAEYDKNGKKYFTMAQFRKYPSWEESISDHSLLLMGDRYERVIRAKNYRECCQALSNCGYATDPNYPALLIKLIESNNLQQYDNIETYTVAPKNQSPVGIVTASKLNVRKSPITGDVIGQLVKGEQVRIGFTENGWHNIYYKNSGGWVSGEYIKL